jgi:TPP-dependent trihydroxycyclohexane-1,2-dione (THcHDO) dehydratase
VASFGVEVFEAADLEGVRDGLARARSATGPAALVCRVEPHRGLLGSDTWWDVGVAEVSSLDGTRAAADEHLETAARKQRFLY